MRSVVIDDFLYSNLLCISSEYEINRILLQDFNCQMGISFHLDRSVVFYDLDRELFSSS